jgi:signal transduction histidine kinase
LPSYRGGMTGGRVLATVRSVRAPTVFAARVRALPVDGLLALGLATWSLAEVATGSAHGPVRVTVPAALAMSMPFLWRRRLPLVVGLVVAAAFAAEQWLGVDTRTQISSMAAMPAAAYAVAAYARLRPAVAVLIAQVALVAATSHAKPSGALFAGIVLGGGWVAGRAMRVHRRRSAALTSAVAREQQRAETAALEERTRIARELHDIVAHAVSVMVIQAGAASEVLRTDPDGALQALDTVRGTGRQALDELRRLLGVLRSGQEDRGIAPQPGLDRLPALVEQVGSPTLTVRLHQSGTRPELPASLELAVYRIVQEALTNTVKHAGATRADISISYHPHGVDVRVVDDGRGPTAREDGAGHGLGGIRERVAMFGGSLTSGPGPDGGFQVHARLPLSTPAVAAP